ncbi:MAG: hypothetical protein HYU51_02150 [Candidatus Rokubacteria bacterium]|nr:hypothetical protein [Candidatus Rokubacteria bacterium]
MTLIYERCEQEGRPAVVWEHERGDVEPGRVPSKTSAYGLCIEHAFVALGEIAVALRQKTFA